MDSEARFEIKLHKEPDDIDEAVYHNVNFTQTRRRSAAETHGKKRFKRYARRTSLEYDSLVRAKWATKQTKKITEPSEYLPRQTNL